MQRGSTVCSVTNVLSHKSGALIETIPGRIMCGVWSQVNTTRWNIIQASHSLQLLHGDGTCANHKNTQECQPTKAWDDLLKRRLETPRNLERLTLHWFNPVCSHPVAFCLPPSRTPRSWCDYFDLCLTTPPRHHFSWNNSVICFSFIRLAAISITQRRLRSHILTYTF